jgi:hypothetical protein
MKETVIFVAMLMTMAAVAPAQAGESDDPTNTELQTRIDALEQELQASEQRQATAQEAAQQQGAAAPGLPRGWWDDTKIWGTAFIDFSHIDHTSDGVKQSDTGANVDLKRFYLAIDHTFDDVWSANITTDVTYDGATKASQLFLKKAYVQANIVDDMLVARLGSADLPWIPFVESLYGYRYVEPTLIDRTKFGTSADWGAHFLGKLADGLVAYQFSVVNGAGYKNSPVGGGANRSRSVDVEGRINLNYDDFVLGLGAYVGKLGHNVEGAAPTYHTANRFDAVAAYTAGDIRAGIEYFKTDNWNNVTTLTGDSAEGWGGFASYRFAPRFAVFARYDYTEPKQKTNSGLHANYYNFGVTWSPTKIVDLSLVYKHDQASRGTIATSNGTIGGITGGSYDEAGLFTQIKW